MIWGLSGDGQTPAEPLCSCLCLLGCYETDQALPHYSLDTSVSVIILMFPQLQCLLTPCLSSQWSLKAGVLTTVCCPVTVSLCAASLIARTHTTSTAVVPPGLGTESQEPGGTMLVA